MRTPLIDIIKFKWSYIICTNVVSMNHNEELNESELEEGVKLRSRMESIAYATVVSENDDGTYTIREVDKDDGSYTYDTPFDGINHTFYLPEKEEPQAV